MKPGPLTTLLAPLVALVEASPIAFTEAMTFPDPSLVKIHNVSFSGNGCPEGTVSSSISADRSQFTFAFESFRSEIGLPGLPITERSKNCQLHLNLQKPSGWQFAVTESTWHGYARLDQGVNASLTNTYYFSHAIQGMVTTKIIINGPEWTSGNYFTVRQPIPSGGLLWSPCGSSGMLNINNRVSLTSSTVDGYGIVGIKEIDNVLQTSIMWRIC